MKLTLKQALGSLAAIPRFFIYKLEWNPEKTKWDKFPWTRDPVNGYRHNPGDPTYQLPYDDAVERLTAWRTSNPELKFTLGFWFEHGSGFWFFDLDGCIRDGTYSQHALDWYARLPGVFFEVSSSGTGVHLVGRDILPPHGTRDTANNCELYSGGRGIAFGADGHAYGSADTSGTTAIQTLAATHFPPPVATVSGDYSKPRADWAGPTNDDDLLAIAMRSASAVAKAGYGVTFAQLFTNAPELDQFYGDGTPDSGRTERDAALAQHLAFWTGCDGPRMERLMRRSQLVREKWDTHRTYLRELTIDRACALQKDVYCKPTAEQALLGRPPPPAPPAKPLPMITDGAPAATAIAEPTVVTPLISDEAMADCESAVALASSGEDIKDVYNRVIPAIQALRIPGALMTRVISKLNEQLSLWDAKVSVPLLRQLLAGNSVGAIAGGTDGAAPAPKPAWADDYVYLVAQDAFLERSSGAIYNGTALHRKVARLPEVPLNNNGKKYDVAELLTEQWHCQQAHDAFYHAKYGSSYMYDSKIWWNTYNPATVPATAATFTGAANIGIDLFQKHIWRMCNGRDDVAYTLMNWLAHQVQKPGHKVRWAPLIVGFEGSGKTLIGKLLRAVMGSSNVKIVNAASLANSGGFTDWANGKAVTMLEEVYVSGAMRYTILNTIKEPVSNDEISINRKGKVEAEIPNGTNYIAFTNHHDALPINNETDRRWLIIFTPFATIEQMLAASGYSSDAAYFDPIFDSIRDHAGEWRKWLMEWPLPDTFPPQRAPVTAEKRVMSDSAKDETESEILALIKAGGPGVTEQAFSSRSLDTMLTMRQVKAPASLARHHMFVRMGYVSASQIWWNGSTHRIWVRPGTSSDPEKLKEILNSSIPG